MRWHQLMTPATLEQTMRIGVGHHHAGRFAEAEATYRRVLAQWPDHADAWHLLGVLAGQVGRLDAAIDLIGRAIAINADVAMYHSNLGEIHRRSGQPEPAIARFERALELNPDSAEAHNNLGNVLWERGRLDAALARYRHAIALRPLYADAHSNLGNALKDMGRLDEAADAYRRAIDLKPDMAEAHNNLGSALLEQGRVDEALACFRTAAAINPDLSKAGSNFVQTLHYHPGYDARAILDEHRHWAQRHAEPLAGEMRPHPIDREPGRSLRIGFLSPDFRDHPVGRLLLPLFSDHDRRQAAFIGYSDVKAPDAVTAKLRAMANEWHDTLGLGDRQVAERIRADRIDILVDLALHTTDNRMLVFARKPAPIQATMLGLPATTGLAAIDYRLTDPFLDPPGATDADYTERSIRLPHCFWIFQPPDESPPVGALPALGSGFVTFGCLNQFAKVSRPALDLWVRILQRLPGSRLVIQSQPGRHLDEVRERFRAGGIAPGRVDFAERVGRGQHLHRYQNLDLCLDPFPYNGHTSTLDALWMGVPVITLAGRTSVGRGGVSILSNVGLTELIASTPDQYVAIAVGLAADRARLSELRAGMRARMCSSPLLDARQYTADIDAAFRWMWERWCEGATGPVTRTAAPRSD